MEPANTDSIYALADWAEYLVAYHQQNLSKAKLTSLFRVKPVEIDEEQVDSVLGELSLRQSLYGLNSPFQLENNIIRPNIAWEDFPEYMMCLIFSLRGVEKEKGKDDGTKLFERMSREVILSYLCNQAEVIGFPNATSLRKQIEHISQVTNERLGARRVRPVDKDKGVDVIAWKSHEDTRDNQIVLLLQCGAGLHFGSKRPISVRAWREFIMWSADPIPGIMVPFVISLSDWLETRDDYNLIFDRVRIFRALRGIHLSDNRLRNELLAWCRERLGVK